MPVQENTVIRKSNSSSFFSQLDFLVISSRLGRIRFIGLASFWFSIIILLSLIIAPLTNPEDMEHASSFSKILRYSTLFLTIIAFLNLPLLIKRRLNDLNFSGWWMIIKVIPYVGFILWLYLLIKPGSKGANKYGEPSLKATRFNYAMILTLPIVVASLFLLGIEKLYSTL